MRLLSLLLAALLVGSLASAPGVRAQALSFETVGDRPVDADDLAFDDDSTLWAIDTEVYRLPHGGTVWEEINQIASFYILPLGPDTLLAGGGVLRRSLDGGQTFTEVFDEGEALFEAPHSGTLLAGTDPGTSGVAYSLDRGATWQQATLLDPSISAEARAVAELPPGHPHAGRLVAATWDGLSYSDDGGRTWAPSSLWGDAYTATGVAVGADGAVYATFGEQWVAGVQVAASTDGGASYEVVYGSGVTIGEIQWIGALPGGADPEVGVVVYVEHDGSVWRSDDGARSFGPVGRVPFTYAWPSSRMGHALLGPEGRLYVAGSKSGADREWVFRTTDPVVGPAVAVAAEPVGVPPGDPVVVGPEGGSFSFAVRLGNETTVPLSVEAWSAVEGPLVREPVAGPVGVSLAPLSPSSGWSRVVRQGVPASAPPGTYTYTVRVGKLGAEVIGEASFEIVKEAGAPLGTGEGGDWTAEGWDEAAAGEAPSSGVSLSVSPNPVRGAATVALSLDVPGEAEVSVYDVLGRRVGALHKGPLGAGAHAFPLDAHALPPGVYVVRAVVGGAADAVQVTVLR